MKRFGFFWLLILILVAGAVYLPGFSKYLRLKRKEADLEREVERIRTEIAKLQEEEHLLKTDLTRFEQVVREELGLVKPGEVVLKVVEEEIPPGKEEPASQNQKDATT